MIGIISHPEKSFRIESPAIEVKSAIEHLILFIKTYKLNKANTVLKQFTYEATEFLGAGLYININLFFISEALTEIKIEVRRKIGLFNKGHEIINANNHVAQNTGLITKIISKGFEKRQSISDVIEADFEEERRLQAEKKQSFPVQHYTKLDYIKLVFMWILVLSVTVGPWYLIYTILF